MSERPTTNRLAVTQPTSGPARNQSLLDRGDPATDDVLLPALEEGLTLLDVEGGRGVPALQSLVLDHLLVHEGPAFWIDANGHATTTAFARITPSRRLLDRVHVARGFTATQHYSAICDLSAAVSRSVRESTIGAGSRERRPPDRDDDSTPQTPSLVVAPAIDAQYRADDALGETPAETLQARALARLRTYAEGYDVPVLLTRSERDGFAAPIATAADHHLKCEQTRLGPRFVGEDFETLVYPVGDGEYYQTTFAYWRQVLGARARQAGREPTASPERANGAAGVGVGVTTDGETVSATANPLRDAWNAAGGR